MSIIFWFGIYHKFSLAGQKKSKYHHTKKLSTILIGQVHTLGRFAIPFLLLVSPVFWTEWNLVEKTVAVGDDDRHGGGENYDVDDSDDDGDVEEDEDNNDGDER